jgi:predicted histidine transporter YuiF (NhaC family)
MKTLLGQLSRGATSTLHKKSCTCIGAFAAILNATQLKALCNELISLITSSKDKVHLTTLVHCVSLVTKTVGNNLTPYLPALVPILLQTLMNVEKLVS